VIIMLVSIFLEKRKCRCSWDIHRGKLSHIQHPGLRYFALFLVREFLARKNITICTGPIIHFLRCAKEGIFPEHNLGAIFSRTLSYGCSS
jgi:hypothetical protein